MGEHMAVYCDADVRAVANEGIQNWGSMRSYMMVFLLIAQAFINTARKINDKIVQGVFDVSNEVCLPQSIHWCLPSPFTSCGLVGCLWASLIPNCLHHRAIRCVPVPPQAALSSHSLYMRKSPLKVQHFCRGVSEVDDLY
jgi:hypothetical protein